VLTAGVDLAAESRGTALIVLDWQDSRATLLELHRGAHGQDRPHGRQRTVDQAETPRSLLADGDKQLALTGSG
jgi:hypothetical protein